MAQAIHEEPVQIDQLRRLDSAWLVPSKSMPGTFHRVADGRCSCKSYKYRRTCSHLKLVQLASPRPTATVERTERWGGGWVVVWLGSMHGACHYQEIDAQRHAEDLRHTSAAERRAWLGQLAGESY